MDPDYAYCTHIYGHPTGSGQWIVYWAVIVGHKENDVKAKIRYDIRGYRVMCQSRPEANIEFKIFLSKQTGKDILKGQRIVNEAFAKSKANQWINGQKAQVSEMLFHHEELECIKEVTDFLDKYGDLE